MKFTNRNGEVVLIKRILEYISDNGWKGFSIKAKEYSIYFFAPLIMKLMERRVPERKIVFCNFAGKGYGGYPGAICNELIKRGTDAKLIWLVEKKSVFPNQVELVNINSFRAIKELGTAKIWVDNCRKSRKIRKSPRQFYLQTWHAGGPALKKIEGDAESYLSSAYIKNAKNDTKMADLFISDCEWQNNNYRQAFWYNGEILNCTTPPNDLFYQDWSEVKQRVFRHFGFNEQHIILYAPTFRNSHTTDCYRIDFHRIIMACKKRFGGEWVFLVRFHPTMSDKQNDISYNSEVINGTSYPQIEELMISSDVMITDFSASMFLAFRWKIKSFLYADDYDEYIAHERPLYFDVNKLPSGFSRSNDELEKAILEFSEEGYRMRCEEFSDRVGFFEGGKSVQTITDRIEQELKG